MADTKTPVSPKVTAGIIWGAVFGVLGAAVAGGAAAIDPHIFDSLGAFGPLVFSAVTLGAAQLAAYLKADPLRQKGAEATKSIEAVNYGAPAPTFPAPVEEVAPAPAPEGLSFGDPGTATPIAAAPAVNDKPADSVIQQ